MYLYLLHPPVGTSFCNELSLPENHSIRERYFSIMLMITMISFAADLLSSLNHASDWLFPFAAAGNYIEIILNTVMIPVYFLYVCTQITDVNLTLKKRLHAILWVLTVLCSMIVLSTAWNGAIFYFDEAKIYHRGELFFILMSILLIMMVIIEIFIVSQRKKIEITYYKSLLVFLLFPVVGWCLQLLNYGLPFSLISITFAAQVVFINIQNKRMDTDYLTGVFNRQALDGYMQNKINTITSQHSFCAMMLDINDFKLINDSFGHFEGDRALIDATGILRASVGQKNFIARYGGDEFCIVFDEDNLERLKDYVEMIHCKQKDYNNKMKKPYQLSFSIGYAVYDPKMGKDSDELLRLIDKNMYHDKKLRKTTNEMDKSE